MRDVSSPEILNIFYFIIRNGIGQKLYNIMIALSLESVATPLVRHKLLKSTNKVLDQKSTTWRR